MTAVERTDTHERFQRGTDFGTLKDHQARRGVAEVYRKYGVSDVTFYKWRLKYSGRKVSDAKRLRSLEMENTNPRHVQ